MSKRRPSNAGAALSLPRPGKPSQLWLRRVFHNTYTRRGRHLAVRGWSVKMQHGGQRRTFSLAARTRVGAAAEAQAIQEKVLAGGWDSVVRDCSGRGGRASLKADARYWKKRLLLRKHPAPAGGGDPKEFSARIEHAGTSCYFPLGSSDPEAAAFQALRIYRRVIGEGWSAAWRSFPREVTLALHWGYDPLLWTYTTLHTLSEDGLRHPTGQPATLGRQTSVLLVEADLGLRKALSQRIDQTEGCCCVPCSTESVVRRQSATGKPALCLVNRELAGSMGLADSGRIGTLAEGVPAVSYEVHTDSEELFALTPGGASGYVLKRTAPNHLLEPILGVLAEGRPTAEGLFHSAESYFQRLLQGGSAGQAASRPAQLTLREQDVLNLMSKGYLDKEIAPALGISAWTVHEHVKRIFEKLQVHSRTEAVLAYLQK